MCPNTVKIDLAKLEAWAGRKYKHECHEFFRCPRCSSLFLGFPDAHIFLIDPRNPKRRGSYNVPRKTRCPHCRHVWYDGESEWCLGEVSFSELAASEWKWLSQSS